MGEREGQLREVLQTEGWIQQVKHLSRRTEELQQNAKTRLQSLQDAGKVTEIRHRRQFISKRFNAPDHTVFIKKCIQFYFSNANILMLNYSCTPTAVNQTHCSCDPTLPSVGRLAEWHHRNAMHCLRLCSSQLFQCDPAGQLSIFWDSCVDLAQHFYVFIRH